MLTIPIVLIASYDTMHSPIVDADGGALSVDIPSDGIRRPDSHVKYLYLPRYSLDRNLLRSAANDNM